MPRTKKVETSVANEATKPAVEEAPVLRGKDILKDMCTSLGVKLGKKTQVKGKLCDPRSPLYDPKVAARRKKEKARRAHNAKIRARRGKK